MGVGDVLILASNIALALIVWRIHRRLESHHHIQSRGGFGEVRVTTAPIDRHRFGQVPPHPPANPHNVPKPSNS